MVTLDEAERVQPDSLAAWAAWLAENHTRSDGVWLVTFKKATGRRAFDYDAAVTEALRYGWVDSLPRSLDDERTMLWFAPRNPRSGWSRANKKRIATLEKQGRLEAAGSAAVATAKADGSWSMLDEVENLTVPDDLARALDDHPGARANWDGFPPSAQRGILEWILQAKRPTTRQNRIRDTAQKAARGERANQWSRRRDPQ